MIFIKNQFIRLFIKTNSKFGEQGFGLIGALVSVGLLGLILSGAFEILRQHQNELRSIRALSAREQLGLRLGQLIKNGAALNASVGKTGNDHFSLCVQGGGSATECNSAEPTGFSIYSANGLKKSRLRISKKRTLLSKNIYATRMPRQRFVISLRDYFFGNEDIWK